MTACSELSKTNASQVFTNTTVSPKAAPTINLKINLSNGSFKNIEEKMKNMPASPNIEHRLNVSLNRSRNWKAKGVSKNSMMDSLMDVKVRNMKNLTTMSVITGSKEAPFAVLDGLNGLYTTSPDANTAKTVEMRTRI